jgi:hypothetical protein
MDEQEQQDEVYAHLLSLAFDESLCRVCFLALAFCITCGELTATDLLDMRDSATTASCI